MPLRKAGFTLLEVMIAVGIGMLAMLAFTQLFTYAARQQKGFTQMSDFEQLKAMSAQVLQNVKNCSATFSGLPFPATGAVTQVPALKVINAADSTTKTVFTFAPTGTPPLQKYNSFWVSKFELAPVTQPAPSGTSIVSGMLNVEAKRSDGSAPVGIGSPTMSTSVSVNLTVFKAAGTATIQGCSLGTGTAGSYTFQGSVVIDDRFVVSFAGDTVTSLNGPAFYVSGTGPPMDFGHNCGTMDSAKNLLWPCQQIVYLPNFSRQYMTDTSSVYRGTIGFSGRNSGGVISFCIDLANPGRARIGSITGNAGGFFTTSGTMWTQGGAKFAQGRTARAFMAGIDSSRDAGWAGYAIETRYDSSTKTCPAGADYIEIQ